MSQLKNKPISAQKHISIVQTSELIPTKMYLELSHG
jgi:hypothetical protein